MADAMTQPFNRLSVTQLGTPVVCCWSLAAVARDLFGYAVFS